jgi:hypothetical protein
MPTIDELLADTPDAPDSGQQLPGGSLGLMAYPEYVLDYLSANVMFAGETRPLKWRITRADGIACAVPTSASIVVYDVSGNVVSGVGATELDPAPPALAQVLGALWGVPSGPGAAGTFLACLTIVETGGETRIDEQIVFVKP